MNYSKILYSYQPVEIGDFMCRYYINEREYIIYSPEQDKISCLELYYFKDLTPYQLAILINYRDEDLEIEEFTFDFVCSRDELITYLYDVKKGKVENLKIRNVSNNNCYLLHEVKSPHKVRNIYQFDAENESYQLLFDNEICYTSFLDNIECNIINICWNPIIFSLLEKQIQEMKPSFLLASSNPMLCAYIYGIAQQRSAEINLCINNDYAEALIFLSGYLKNKKIDKSFSYFSDNKIVTISVDNWNPITLVKFISKAQKRCNEKYGEEEFFIYHLETICGQSFITFPHLGIALKSFFIEILKELRIEGISYSEW